MNKILTIKRVVLSLLVILPFTAKAQTDIQLSQQLFNRVYYNPAAAGASQYTNGVLIARQQWVGFPKSPQLLVFSGDTYLPKINSGLGLSIIADRLGIEHSNNFNLSYSYHLRVGSETNLSFGLSAGVLYRSVDAGSVVFPDPTDPNTGILMQEENKLSPDFNFGLELNHRNFTLGAAVTHLARSSSKADDLTAGRHFYLYGRYRFTITPEWDLVPTLAAQNNIKDYQLEANLMCFYKQKYWLGASFRTNEKLESESLVAMLGFYIADLVRIGYAYDLNVGKLNSFSSGSHELMLGIRIKPKTSSSNKTPRLFLEY